MNWMMTRWNKQSLVFLEKNLQLDYPQINNRYKNKQA